MFYFLLRLPLLPLLVCARARGCRLVRA
jgi:hypothetical protein